MMDWFLGGYCMVLAVLFCVAVNQRDKARDSLRYLREELYTTRCEVIHKENEIARLTVALNEMQND